MGRPKGSKNKPKSDSNLYSTAYIQRQQNKTKRNNQMPKVTNLIKTDFSPQEEPRGEAVSICKICKNQFEQLYVKEQNRYTSFKECPSCRGAKEKKMNKKLEEGQNSVHKAILDYEPYPYQVEMHNAFQNHRFLVANCFTPGQMVLGCDKNIEDIKVGEYVLDCDNNLKQVYKTYKHRYSGDLYTFEASGILPFSVTSEHPVLFAKIISPKSDFPYMRENRFLTAEEIYDRVKRFNKKENYQYYLQICRPNGKEDFKTIADVELDEDLAWLLGVYCRVGRPKQGKAAIWLNKNSLDIRNMIKSVCEKLDFKINDKTFIFEDKQILRFFSKTVSNYTSCKKIPMEILYHENVDILKAFLDGLFSQTEQKNCKYKLQTTSKVLALQIQLAFARFGYFAKIKEKPTKQDDIYVVSYDTKLKEKKAYYVDRNSVFVKIDNVKKSKFSGTVYNLGVERDTFNVNGIKVHNCGNRTGKDRFSIMEGIMYFIECLNENRHIDRPDLVPSVYWWIIAPIDKLSLQVWRELKKYFPKDWVVAVSNDTKTMQTIGGGVIEVRSAYDPESLVGVGLDLVTITEAARISDLGLVWANLEARLSSPGRGRAKDRGNNDYGMGKAIINSSPIGKNEFYKMWCWGQKSHSEYSSNWVSFTFPWTANPVNEQLAKQIVNTKYGEITYEEDLRRRLTDRVFRQNYLADFLAYDGTVFKDFEEKCIVNPYSPEMKFNTAQRKAYIEEWKKPIPYRQYRISWDIATGSSGDTPAVIIRDKETNHIVQILSLYGKNYDQQYDAIAFWSKYYNNAECVYSLTGHTPVLGQLSKRGVPEIPIDEQGGRKKQYVQTLELAVQNKAFKIILDGDEETSTCINQMNDYTEKDGKYSNNEQKHDDYVSALYLNFYDYEVQVFSTVWTGLMDCV